LAAEISRIPLVAHRLHIQEDNLNRPTGVKILAVLLFAYGAAFAVRIGMLYWTLYSENRVDGMAKMISWGLVASVAMVTAVGLWSLKERARWGVFLIGGRNLAYGAFGISVAPSELRGEYTALLAFYVILFGAIAIYLMRPDVERAFADPYRENDWERGKSRASRKASGAADGI
jgi:hypothetical protein